MFDRVVGLASILVDVTLAVPRLPERGGDMLASALGTAPGGGLNAISATARLGVPTAYAGPVGSGPYGELVRAALAAEGISLLSRPRAGDTGYCIALLEPDGERTFVTVAGVEAELSDADLAGLVVGADTALYVSGYDLGYPGSGPALTRFVGSLPGRSAGGPFLALDPGPLVADIPPDSLAVVLGRADLVSLSRREWELLTGRDARSALSVGDATVVRREGPDGATVITRDARFQVPGVAAEVMDTNGAGDVHLGALLAGLSWDLSWRQATELANRAAALAVARPGGASGPTRAELGLA